MEWTNILKEYKQKLDRGIEFFESECKTFRTGRANIGILDQIKVELYGQFLPINQVANLSIQDSNSIIAEPWDKNTLKEIEKAIMQSELSLNCVNNGLNIRIIIPPLTEERRKGLVKVLEKKLEEAKIGLRNIRRDFNHIIKEKEKIDTISQDELRKIMEQIQKLLDKSVEQLENLFTKKKSDILEI